ncbi:DUF7282 domain-containing protein [Halorientalis marina]|jgi:PGF-CTERM protein|uniref:DUF7282 domain-containing protein n=1 Tax=Halorientalis marina TaxID=2931976 RepID=UPI001FF5C498|nr:BGTF surface domain-containing protein [Halorientalis marina]
MTPRSALGAIVLAALLIGSAGATDAVTAPSSAPATNTTAQDAADIGTWTAPAADFDDLDDREAVRTAIGNGSLTRDDTVADRDVAVLAVPASGAFGALDRQKDENEPYADAFVDLVGSREGFRFHLNQTNPAPNLAPARLDLAATNENDGLRVVPDEANGTLFVALKTDRLVLDRPDRAGVRVRPGQEYEANFTIAESVGLSGGRRTSLGTVEIAERTAGFETTDGTLRLDLGRQCNAVAGQSSVAPGTDVTVRLRGTGDAFSLTRDVTVDRNGTFRTDVENLTRPSETAFVATVRGFPDSETDGVVGFGRSLTTVAASDQSGAGRTVTVDSVFLFEPGFVVLYPADAAPERTAPARCPVEIDRDRAADTVGVSVRLPEDRSTNVTVRLDDPLAESRRLVAVPFLDSNRNGRFDPGVDDPVFVNGTLVAADLNVSLAANETTLTTTAPPTTDSPTTATTPTTTTSPTPHPPDTPDPETATTAPPTTADGPGFGPLAALLALVALAALATARRS